MALKNYFLLKGVASALALDDDQSPHIEVRIEAEGVSYRLAINARSAVAPHDLLYRKQDPFVHPMLAALETLPAGLIDLRNERPDLALDYARGGFVQREAMTIAPFERAGPQNDLRDFIEPIVNQGIGNEAVTFYAFGERWGPEPHTADKYFGFLPGNGVHDIHMNQGSRGRFRGSNGVNQDGALVVHQSDRDHWSAVFFAFQSQSWDTDAATGHPTEDEVIIHPDIDPLMPAVSLVAALINPTGAEEGKESVTLMNRSDTLLTLDGWQLADRTGRTQELVGKIGAGEALKVTLAKDPDAPRLGNKGGKIVLLSPDGVTVHAVEYQKHQAAREGWTTIF